MRAPKRAGSRGGRDRGVSPVIGVILMVAITVVLAAVIGTFVLDLGQQAGDPAPSPSLVISANAAEDELSIRHRGGGSLDAAETRLILVNRSSGNRVTLGPASAPAVLSAGGVASIKVNDGTAGGDETVDWNDDGSAEYAGDGSDDLPGVRAGIEYSLWLVDTTSERVYFETTVRA